MMIGPSKIKYTSVCHDANWVYGIPVVGIALYPDSLLALM
jgi:hypothetical protein